MDISVESINGISVARVSGRMDATNADSLTDMGKRLMGEGVTKIIVELSGLEYISSAGLRSILMLAKTCRAKKVSLAFAGMQQMVADMFRISGFQSILVTYPDEASAVSGLS